jgi:hypothetical protein
MHPAGSVLPVDWGEGKWVVWATAAVLAVPLAQLKPNREDVSQHHRDRMAVKAWPHPPLVLIPAQLFLGLLMELLDRISTMSRPRQLCQHAQGGQVTPAEGYRTKVGTNKTVLAALALSAGLPPASPADLQRYAASHEAADRVTWFYGRLE